MNNFVQRYCPDTIVLGIFANDLRRIPSESYFKDYYNKAGWNRYQHESPSYAHKSFIARVVKIGRIITNPRKKLKNGFFLYKEDVASRNYIATSEYVGIENILLDRV